VALLRYLSGFDVPVVFSPLYFDAVTSVAAGASSRAELEPLTELPTTRGEGRPRRRDCVPHSAAPE
jgi:hypothetical protein